MTAPLAEAEVPLAAVRRLAATRAGVALPHDADELPLGSGGLGFDSVRLVELLLDCERELGLAFEPELLADPGLSIDKLAAHVARTCV